MSEFSGDFLFCMLFKQMFTNLEMRFALEVVGKLDNSFPSEIEKSLSTVTSYFSFLSLEVERNYLQTNGMFLR